MKAQYGIFTITTPRKRGDKVFKVWHATKVASNNKSEVIQISSNNYEKSSIVSC